jgi:hypothetical protein
MGNILGWLVGTRSEQNRELDGDAPMAGRRRAQGGGRGAHARGNQSWPFIGGVHSALTQHKGRGGVRPARRSAGKARRGAVGTRHVVVQAPRRSGCALPRGTQGLGMRGRRGPEHRCRAGRHVARGRGALWRESAASRRDVTIPDFVYPSLTHHFSRQKCYQV